MIRKIAAIVVGAFVALTLIGGGLVLAGTTMSLISIPHPMWFSVGSVIAAMVTTYLMSQIAGILATVDSVEQNLS